MTLCQANATAQSRSREDGGTWLVVDVPPRFQLQRRPCFEVWTPRRWKEEKQITVWGLKVQASWTAGEENT